MRVRFDASLMPSGNEMFRWLDDGAEYDVLEIEVSPSNSIPGLRVMFRIEAEETPAPFAAETFHLVDGSLPQTWTVALAPGGRVTLGPERWQNWDGQYSFWEDFFSGVPEVQQPAREAFEIERSTPPERRA